MPKPREASKCREWEKLRRNRLNNSFTALSKVLPCYDPSLTLSKIDILDKAATYIEELQSKVKVLLSSDSVNKPERNEIKKLYDRIKKLLTRNEQLCNLLKDSGITVPAEYGKIKKFKKPYRWSNKFTPEQAKLLARNDNEKENSGTKHKVLKQKSKISKTVIIKQRRNLIKKSESKKGLRNSVLKANSQSCFIITNAPSDTYLPYSTSSKVGATNSGLLTSPLVASKIKPTKPRSVSSTTNTTLTTLGPGTLIFANGNIVPVLPQTPTFLPTNQTIIANSAPILVNPNASKTTLIVVASTSANVVKGAKDSQLSSLPRIKPKVCFTKTTQINKVPIPALSSSFAKSFVYVSKSADSVKVKDAPKKGGKKESESIVNKTTKTESLEKISAAIKHKLAEKVEDSDQKRLKLEESLQNKNDKDAVPQTFSIDSLCKENETSQVSKDVTETPERLSVVEEPQHDLIKVLPLNTEISTNQDNLETNTSKPSIKDVTLPQTVEQPLQPPQSTENVEPAVETPKPEPEPTKTKNLELNLPQSELSNDIFASLQVPTGGQNPDSTSPTAAFLLAFPLVSTVKVTEVIEEENSDSQRGTPTLLQIGTMDGTKPTNTDSFTPSLLNLDTFSFFSGKESFYDNFVSLNTVAAGKIEAKATEGIKKDVTIEKIPPKAAYIPPFTKESAVRSESFLQNSFTKQTNFVKENAPLAVENYFPVANVRSFPEFHNKTESVVPKNDTYLPQQPTVNFGTNCAKTATQPKSKPQDVLCTNNLNAEISSSLEKFGNYANYSNSFYDSAQSICPVTTKQKNTINKSSSSVHYSVTTTKTNYTVSQCNTFNPFTDITKSMAVSNCNNVLSKNYTEPLYTNSSNYTYSCNMDGNFNSNNYPKSGLKNDNKSYYGSNYDNSYAEYKKYDTTSQYNYYQNQNAHKDKYLNQRNKPKPTTTQPRAPVNWMTTPDLRQQPSTSDYILSSFPKDTDFTYPANAQTTYFNTSASIHPGGDAPNAFADKKTSSEPAFSSLNSFARTDDENQFNCTWSPTKLPQLLDGQHTFVPSTLPTLVGDLALGNTHFADQKSDSKGGKDRAKDTRRSKTQSYDNSQGHLFSVSQLMDDKSEVVPARTTTRRSSGSRTKTSAAPKPTKRNQNQKDTKESLAFNNKVIESGKSLLKQNQGGNYGIQHNHDWINEPPKNNQVVKTNSSSYSAEALIGHKQQTNFSSASKTLPVPFLTDNIIHYFPSVDIQQDNTFVQQNQNYQTNNTFGHNFTSSIQNNSYSSNTFIPSGQSYLPTSNFVPDLTDYNPLIPDNLFSHTAASKTSDNKYSKFTPTNKHPNVATNRTEERKHSALVSASCSVNVPNTYPPKKSKKKQANEGGIPGFVDFSFLSMPATINSPILPDDFHTNFLPPTPQLYSCKNSLYPKQGADLNSGALLPLASVSVTRSNVSLPAEISPSVNNNVSTSLTNFNLSTIFPEINKRTAPLPDLFAEQGRIINKDVHKSYLVSTQGPFCNTSTFTPTYSTIHSFTNS